MENYSFNLNKLEIFIKFIKEHNNYDILYNAILYYLETINLHLKELTYHSITVNNYFEYVDKINQFKFYIYFNIKLINDIIKYLQQSIQQTKLKRKSSLTISTTNTNPTLRIKKNKSLNYLSNLKKHDDNVFFKNIKETVFNDDSIINSFPNIIELINFIYNQQPIENYEHAWTNYIIQILNHVSALNEESVSVNPEIINFPFDYFNCYILKTDYNPSEDINNDIKDFIRILNIHIKSINIIKEIQEEQLTSLLTIPYIYGISDNNIIIKNNISILYAIFYSQYSKRLIDSLSNPLIDDNINKFKNALSNINIQDKYNQIIDFISTNNELLLTQDHQIFLNAIYINFGLNILNLYIKRNTNIIYTTNNIGYEIISIIKINIIDDDIIDESYKILDITLNSDTIFIDSGIRFKLDYVLIKNKYDDKLITGITNNNKKYIYNYHSNIYKYTNEPKIIPFPPIEFDWNSNINTIDDITIYHNKNNKINSYNYKEKYNNLLYMNDIFFGNTDYTTYVFVKE